MYTFFHVYLPLVKVNLAEKKSIWRKKNQFGKVKTQFGEIKNKLGSMKNGLLSNSLLKAREFYCCLKTSGGAN